MATHPAGLSARWMRRRRSTATMQKKNVLAMAASYDPDPAEFLGMRLPVTFDTCELIAERWANWMRHDPAVAVLRQCRI